MSEHIEHEMVKAIAVCVMSPVVDKVIDHCRKIRLMQACLPLEFHYITWFAFMPRRV